MFLVFVHCLVRWLLPLQTGYVGIYESVGHQPWAVVQLRQDNKLGTLYNIVGFQTKMRKYAEQTRVFRMMPGLENAEFARLGGLHRNTFINSPRLLNESLQMKAMPRLRFAGQITGCEGYGIRRCRHYCGSFCCMRTARLFNVGALETTAMGAILSHITGGGNAETFQPMNVNFGLFPYIAESPTTYSNSPTQSYASKDL